MTKIELLEALKPFTDETEVMIGDRGHWYEVDHSEYALRFNGYGCLVLTLGAKILLRAAPRSTHNSGQEHA